jgi:hypothetical protein
MRTYTFISDYKGNTHINQYQGPDVYNALVTWGENLDPHIYSKNKMARIREEIQDEDLAPIPVKSVNAVWCCAFLSGKSFFLLNIVEGMGQMKGGENHVSLFTFVADFKGGTYISQYRANDVSGALHLWADNLDREYFPYRLRNSIQKKLKTQDGAIAALEAVDSVWRISCVIHRSLLILNIVETFD